MSTAKWNDRLKEAMTAAGFTQDRLALTIGSGQSRIGNYCRGEREPDFTTLAKLISVLGISADWLLFGSKNSSSIVKTNNISQKLAKLHAALPKKAQLELEAAAKAFELAYCVE